MKQLKLIFAGMTLSYFALFPAAAPAADVDELDVTMEVLDSIGELDGQVMEMRGPEGYAPEQEVDYVREEEGGSDQDDLVDEEYSDDGFEHDKDFEPEENKDYSEKESDYEEGEDVDTDEPQDDGVSDADAA